MAPRKSSSGGPTAHSDTSLLTLDVLLQRLVNNRSRNRDRDPLLTLLALQSRFGDNRG